MEKRGKIHIDTLNDGVKFFFSTPSSWYGTFSSLYRSRDYQNNIETITECIPRKTNHKHQNSIGDDPR